MKTKKAQLAEFIAIIILLLVLVMVGLFSSLEIQQTKIEKLKSAFASHKLADASLSANIMGNLVSPQGYSAYELMGAYSCYGTQVVDFGRNVDVISQLRYIFDDNLYGENRWMLTFVNTTGEEIYLTSSLFSSTRPQNITTAASYDFIYPVPCLNTAKDATILILE